MNSTAVVPATQAERALPMSAAEMRAQVNRIQEVMQAVMRKDVHYGVVPGTKKPSLLKPGAEVLAATFHIAPDYIIDDLSTPGMIRYRVKCIGTHQTSGVVMGAGMGECSTMEEKYRWRKANSEAEFGAMAEDRRRIKYYSDNTVKQVQADPWDAANTALKMACKRAQIAMTLNVTAASDIFTQDVEDLPEHLRDSDEVREGKQKAREEADVAAKTRLEEATAALKVATTREQVAKLWQTWLNKFVEADDRTGADAWKAAVREKGDFLNKLGEAKPEAQAAGTGGEKAGGPTSAASPPADGFAAEKAPAVEKTPAVERQPGDDAEELGRS